MPVDKQSYVDITLQGHPEFMGGSMLMKATLVESVFTPAPLLTLTIQDQHNIFREKLPFTGGEVFEVKTGVYGDPTKSDTFEFVVLKGWSQPFQSAEDGTLWTLVCTIKPALKLVDRTYCRSFTRKLASDVAKLMASEIGATGSFIDPTDLSQNWVQPNWTNMQLLSYLSKKSWSTSRGVGGYQFFLDRFGRLTFASIDYLMALPSVRTIAYAKDDNLVPTNDLDRINLMQIENRLSTMLYEGAAGMSAGYFDVLEGEYKTVRETVKDTRHAALSDKLFIREQDLNAASRHLGHLGRIDDAQAVKAFGRAPLHNEMIPRIASLMRFPIVTNASMSGRHYFPGQKVTLEVKSPDPDAHWDEVYSGDYLITTVEQHLLGQPFAKLMLTRAGASSPRLKGYLTPPGGKL